MKKLDGWGFNSIEGGLGVLEQSGSLKFGADAHIYGGIHVPNPSPWGVLIRPEIRKVNGDLRDDVSIRVKSTPIRHGPEGGDRRHVGGGLASQGYN